MGLRSSSCVVNDRRSWRYKEFTKQTLNCYRKARYHYTDEINNLPTVLSCFAQVLKALLLCSLLLTYCKTCFLASYPVWLLWVLDVTANLIVSVLSQIPTTGCFCKRLT